MIFCYNLKELSRVLFFCLASFVIVVSIVVFRIRNKCIRERFFYHRSQPLIRIWHKMATLVMFCELWYSLKHRICLKRSFRKCFFDGKTVLLCALEFPGNENSVSGRYVIIIWLAQFIIMSYLLCKHGMWGYIRRL